MVDVGEKSPSSRRAVAEVWIDLPDAVYDALKENGVTKKGDPGSVAEIAGIMGAKKTPGLIPLCHGIRLDSVRVRCEIDDVKRAVRVECTVSARDVTGVEMEALTGASIAALAFYDMCKALDKGMIINGLKLLEKSGGKSGLWRAGAQGEKSHER
jgi:cyclic pyranopterin phosphate synthase